MADIGPVFFGPDIRNILACNCQRILGNIKLQNKFTYIRRPYIRENKGGNGPLDHCLIIQQMMDPFLHLILRHIGPPFNEVFSLNI